VLHGVGQNQEAHISQLLEDLVGREGTTLLPLIHKGVDVFVYDFLERVSDLLMVNSMIRGTLNG
jgi:hypothetical protein